VNNTARFLQNASLRDDIIRIHFRDALSPVRDEETSRREWRDSTGQLRCREVQLVEGCIDHMLQHLDKPLRISALSTMTGYSNSHFFVLFKSATGYAPKKFFIRVRMEQACKMLSALTVSVKQVAAALGYEDEFYFSRLFKSVIGIAPRDYRRKLIASTKSPMPHEGGRAVKVKAMSI
jgi:AraC family transcriptional regulator of arabinose operon